MNKPKSIFLIEDDEHDQYFFTHIMESIANVALHGIADNGKKALDMLENPGLLPDIIFTDIHMPVMDGIACLSALRARQHLQLVPIVVFSSDTTRLELIRTLGANAFVKKSSDLAGLKAQISRLVHLDYSADSDIADQTFKRAY